MRVDRKKQEEGQIQRKVDRKEQEKGSGIIGKRIGQEEEEVGGGIRREQRRGSEQEEQETIEGGRGEGRQEQWKKGKELDKMK